MKIIENQTYSVSDVLRMDVQSLQLKPTEFFRVYDLFLNQGRAENTAGESGNFCRWWNSGPRNLLYIIHRLRKPDLQELQGKELIYDCPLKCAPLHKS